ncbi:hypothetical protein DWV12_05735 [Clostridium botulinum]|uniref:glycan biosynthesis hexose transferase WsfD n=1 Tax=Clostridium botulinum TaxID=1491 RepID=UPI001414A296|nr:hypothetical protein [Clostridium botulinum]MCS6103082.1 hypothetical protein [Clostridium botulinum]MCS6106899.1 hypothetical protein [Clostridium botulinum]NFL59849.1 hypothetical protein [Clostridium botulinum]NFL61811.1 hypothetical protein [Clostridium botulinum]NFS12681.1 hypothetical protein [Clostridium botulinum]
MINKFKSKSNLNRFLFLTFIIASLSIISFILFKYPHMGVADQGDFDRVMNASGISLLDSDKNNPNFVRFYDYIVTDYTISNFFKTITGSIVGSSIGFLILILSIPCKLFNNSIFRTEYLAISYSIIYILSITMILKYLNIKNSLKLTFIGILSLFILFDGNYIIWFNSFYGEPMMLCSLLLLIFSILYYINYKYVKKNNHKIISKIVYILLATFLFLGSKMQVVTAVPFLMILLLKIILDNKQCISKKNFVSLIIALCIVMAYPLIFNTFNGSISNDTQYNSVFYGVLNGSKTPKQDLIDLGLNPDMASEAGKHSYLSDEEYVKYIPRTEITNEEFYSKMSNSKLAKFYLTHPVRLIQGMQYTASKAFYTSTVLGKTSIDYSTEPTIKFSRFTSWSDFRENYLPKSLLFIISTFLLIFIYTFYLCIRNENNEELKNKVFLIWTIMFIAVIQFPMPFVGNGKADTAKQLFLFNFIFDLLLIITASYAFSKITDIFSKKR